MPIPSMSNSSASGSGTGDQSQGGNVFQGGSVNFAAGSSAGINPVFILVTAVVVVWLITKRK